MIPAPVVILSAPHSEAARLAAMLGQHPRAFALPDLRLFYADTVGELLDLFEHAADRSADGLLRATALLFVGGEDDTSIGAARNYLRHRSGWSTAALLDVMLRRLAPRTAVLHDPVAALRVTDLDRWLDAFGEAAYIHWCSAPLAFAAAARSALAGRLFVAPDYYDHGSSPPQIEPLLVWHRVHETLMRELPTRPGLRWRRASLERLNADPRGQLRALSTWLGWGEPPPAQLEWMLQPERWRYARRGPDSAPFGVEPEFLADPRFSAPLATQDLRGAPSAGVLPAASARLAAALQRVP